MFLGFSKCVFVEGWKASWERYVSMVTPVMPHAHAVSCCVGVEDLARHERLVHQQDRRLGSFHWNEKKMLARRARALKPTLVISHLLAEWFVVGPSACVGMLARWASPCSRLHKDAIYGRVVLLLCWDLRISYQACILIGILTCYYPRHNHHREKTGLLFSSIF